MDAEFIQGLKSLASEIGKSHSEPGNSQIQTQIFMKCLNVVLLPKLKDELHLFCNADLQPVVAHTLIMFSFPGATSSQRLEAERRMNRSLNYCSKCVYVFHQNLSHLRSRFILFRKIPVQHVIQFLQIVADWLLNRLQGQMIEYGMGASCIAVPDLEEYRPLSAFMYECLSCVALIKSHPDFRSKLAKLLSRPEVAQLKFIETVLPVPIFYMVEGTPTESAYAFEALEQKTTKPIKLSSPLVDEINYHCYRLQDAKYFTADLSTRFWTMIDVVLTSTEAREFSKLLHPLELDIMSSYTQIRLFPIIRVLLNNIMAQLKESLRILLIVFEKCLSFYEGVFWKLAEGVHPLNVLDTILTNSHYSKCLELPQSSEYTSWIPSFLTSLNVQKNATAIKIAEFFLRRESSGRQSPDFDSASFLMTFFDFSAAKDPNALLRFRDIRSAVSKHSSSYTNLARSGLVSAIKLICACIKYDTLVTALNSAVVELKEVPTFFEYNYTIWNDLKKLHLSNTEFAIELLKSLSDTCSVIVFKEKKNLQSSKEAQAALGIHNREAQTLCENIAWILDKLTVLDPEDIKVVLNCNGCLEGLWSCIFNPKTSQSALAIMYQVFDSEGRYETISNTLSIALKSNLNAINLSLASIARSRVFEPCPKALRILMDVIKSITDPLQGIITTQLYNLRDCKLEIQAFWECCWHFLVMVYQQTLLWAGMYHLSDLIEFTRDALDTSHLLLDSFRPLVQFFADLVLENKLFDIFMSTFIHVIVWLRLGDTSLLNSCVLLVFKGFDLAKELNFNVDKNFIVTFAKYGAKAKKYNNKLSEQQRSMVLAKAGEFDPTLVLHVIEETAKERSTLTSSRSATPQGELLGASYVYQSRPKEPKQLTLSRFGVVTKEAPVAPPPPAIKNFKANNLEAMRNELKSIRKPLGPTSTPAPARPAGFNQKSTAVGRSLNALKPKRHEDSSSAEEDDDVDISDLFLESKKKSKIIELDIHGQPVKKVATAKKVDNERKEEERMRLRLNVNLKPLYSTILKWNYNIDSEYPSDARDVYKPIKTSYSSAKEYVTDIEPLLLLECWQGIQASRSTGQELPFEVLVGSRTTCDGFFDVYVSLKRVELAAKKIGESDLLVLGYAADKNLGSPQEIAAYLKRTDSQTCLAKVRDIKYVNADYCDLTVRVFPQGSMMGLLTPKSMVVAMKVMQMITVEREYSSLRGLQYYDLCDDILSGKPTEAAPISDTEAEKVCRKLGVNMSQAKAIIGSNREEGFSLIQGPPGTGKTKTILGIVGHFLTAEANPHTIAVPESTKGDLKPAKKVLICAPSNAAVDELVVRLKGGVSNGQGQTTVPKIVRLGRSDAMNTAVRDVSLEELLEKHLQGCNATAAIDPSIRQEHTKCIEERDEVREALKKGGLGEKETIELESRLREINKRRAELGKRLDEQREKVSIAARTRDIERRHAQAKIINDAQVICSTLSGSAHDFLAGMSIKFDQVIIDEACQSVELSAIIPLRYGCKKCVMVGDPNQLPPTVLSQRASSFGYDESLFVRMQKQHPGSIYLLDVQYRMHPDISRFPSVQFYNSRLSDGEGMRAKTTRSWHAHMPLTPYRFFDITSRHQQNVKSKSFFNTAEAKVALELVKQVMLMLPTAMFRGKIGIISPYKEQIRVLRDVFQRQYGNAIFNEIDFNTVDGFQGQEKEIIIMSCVRASDTGSVGFLSDVRRMNVALTRARTTLWILGNKSSLKRDKIWEKLIEDAALRDSVSPAEPGFLKQYAHLRNLRHVPEKSLLGQDGQPETKTQTDASKSEANLDKTLAIQSGKTESAVSPNDPSEDSKDAPKESKDKEPKDKGSKDKAPKDKAPKDKEPKDKELKDCDSKDKELKEYESKNMELKDYVSKLASKGTHAKHTYPEPSNPHDSSKNGARHHPMTDGKRNTGSQFMGEPEAKKRKNSFPDKKSRHKKFYVHNNQDASSALAAHHQGAMNENLPTSNHSGPTRHQSDYNPNKGNHAGNSGNRTDIPDRPRQSDYPPNNANRTDRYAPKHPAKPPHVQASKSGIHKPPSTQHGTSFKSAAPNVFIQKRRPRRP